MDPGNSACRSTDPNDVGIVTPESTVDDQIQAIKTITLHSAAAVIAHPGFPDEELLPRIDPIPFNNVGHLPLIDYATLCRILWDCAAEIEATGSEKVRQRQKKAGSGATLAFVATFVVVATNVESFGMAAAAATAVACLVYFTVISDKEARDAIAEIKARNIQLLMDDTIPPRPPRDANDTTLSADVGVSEGLLKPTRVLVFIAKGPGDPFPGLGWIQAQESYICPPALKKRVVQEQSVLMHELTSVLLEVAERVRGLGMRCTTRTGYLASVDGDTLQPESKWLNKDGRPLLFQDFPNDSLSAPSPSHPFALDAQDPDALARTYLGLQVYYPEYQTMVTIAARLFMASGSVALELLAFSLGPPRLERRDLREALLRHRRLRKDEGRGGHVFGPEKPKAEKRASRLTLHLEAWNKMAQDWQDSLRGNFDVETLAALFDRKKRLELENARAEELRRQADNKWVGRYTMLPNWRENCSHIMADGSFVSKECRTSIQALYATVAKAALLGLSRQGYNIDAYKDARGKVTIDKRVFVNNERVDNQMNVQQGSNSTVNASQSASSKGEERKKE